MILGAIVFYFAEYRLDQDLSFLLHVQKSGTHEHSDGPVSHQRLDR
jgi:hypothetical protein